MKDDAHFIERWCSFVFGVGFVYSPHVFLIGFLLVKLRIILIMGLVPISGLIPWLFPITNKGFCVLDPLWNFFIYVLFNIQILHAFSFLFVGHQSPLNLARDFSDLSLNFGRDVMFWVAACLGTWRLRISLERFRLGCTCPSVFWSVGVVPEDTAWTQDQYSECRCYRRKLRQEMSWNLSFEWRREGLLDFLGNKKIKKG